MMQEQCSRYQEDLEYITGQMTKIYRQIVEETKVEIYEKSTYDAVTSYDLEMEKRLIESIRKREPGAHILSEEFNAGAVLEERTWIIDPIDGTCNFSHGIPTYGVQCALVEEGEIKIAAIYLPFLNELYTAVRGMGAKCNDQKIHCAKREVNHSLVSFGDFTHNDERLFELEARLIRHVASKVERLRMYGAASVDFAFCAGGRLDGNFSFACKAWDVAPGILLCQEAGMIVTDAYGDPYHMGCDTVAVFTGEELRDACCMYTGTDL